MLRRLALACALAGCAAPAAAQSAPPAPTPRLLVFITVDQMRPDYFTRWPGQLTGGLARLYGGGAVFTDAHQDHAITETAPGHSVVMSGRFPRGTGIVSNSSGVNPDPQTRLVGYDSVGSSPFRFRGSVLFDWIRTNDPRSRALSVSRKDRGAILPLGRAHQSVFWYAPNGSFVTSTYYADTLPAWVRAFNARRLPQGYAGKAWDLAEPASRYAEKDDVAIENRGRSVFPHPFPSTPDSAAAAFPSFPQMDSVTLQMALAGLREMRLGDGPATDVLAVSLSSTDAVGHAYGPDSREIHDQVLRLDRWLGAFLDSVYAGRDPSTVVVALTADHGVTPFPEVADPAHAAAMHVSDAALLRWLRDTATRYGVPAAAMAFEEGGLLRLDPAALVHAGRDPNAVASEFVALARSIPGVLRADLLADLARGDTVNDAVARRWVHMVPRDLPFYAAVTLRPGFAWGNRPFAEHGSPSDLDTHVPIIFYGAPFRPGRYDVFARTADIAPTLARALGVNPTEAIDGRVLAPAFR
ncbi:alkaline phosphatase family protein [Longimicrobium sp.]|uniref:alkaline phosphatase family protein n=1 Tax=Longimicrobium sp. TaxID=2029185 RepID=UPI002CD366F6|nr:alkaline phosphatase family protein [Longimicrobium sp.]HSU13994.1 alkaline phosphatase family protein [Longimicrobium sp.]